MALYIGLMSGTSLDGADGVLVELDEAGARPPGVRAHVHRDMPPALREELLALNMAAHDELHRAALAANALMGLYVGVVEALLARTGCAAADVSPGKSGSAGGR